MKLVANFPGQVRRIRPHPVGQLLKIWPCAVQPFRSLRSDFSAIDRDHGGWRGENRAQASLVIHVHYVQHRSALQGATQEYVYCRLSRAIRIHRDGSGERFILHVSVEAARLRSSQPALTVFHKAADGSNRPQTDNRAGVCVSRRLKSEQDAASSIEEGDAALAIGA